MTVPKFDEMDLLKYILATEEKFGVVFLGKLVGGALAHPVRVVDMLGVLESRKLIAFSGPMSNGILNMIKPLVDSTKHLEGPTECVPDAHQLSTFAQRGVFLKPGEKFVNAGMACIAFNRIARERNFRIALGTRVHVTDDGRRLLAGPGMAEPSPQP